MLECTELQKKIFGLKISEPRLPEDEVRLIESLDAILAGERFGLVLSVEGKAAFTLEGKKQLNLWFKKNRQLLKERCIGLVRVNRDASKLARLKSKALSLAMPCPYRVVEQDQEALEYLRRKLE